MVKKLAKLSVKTKKRRRRRGGGGGGGGGGGLIEYRWMVSG